MVAPKEGKDLKIKYKRLLWFLGGYFVLALVISYLLILAGVSPIANGVIIIALACILYLLFLIICANIDKKKAAKDAEEKHRDPFAH